MTVQENLATLESLHQDVLSTTSSLRDIVSFMDDSLELKYKL